MSPKPSVPKGGAAAPNTHVCIWSLLLKGWEDDAQSLAIATAAMFVTGLVYYAVLVSGPWVRSMLRDKGVKRFEGIVWRYSSLLCILISVASDFVKMCLVLAFMNTLGNTRDSLCMYLQVGAFLWGVVLTVSHNWMWEQRPAALIIANAVSELLLLEVGAYALHTAKHYQA
mmetsp:Transcript_46401/g.143219  ORF Transcript_46401/g.143219 Transcript_46401/m.143219 type:complete len:171 (-) Transcript_46401:251-763(-)|eukprot:CAMPEP_0174855470 /NCGR_PEP_ID=MMETSP1114-20130205/33366_1 /TAXON_ID=312471 /ORGANISM="Neobodo designis, Strain CCAP 1951/1" /LENGTH=170 /DNA_ID=CAMNT_0016090211 /DNA_START=49 /DNA_END=561 /DNA_ORIENTATION=+